MVTVVLALLAVTPVSLQVDLSRDTTARLGPRVRELIESRLAEEGFPVEPGAKLKLGVEELHGVLRLWAKVGEHEAESELRPASEWPAELGFEVAQRLAVLAHEAEGFVPPTPAAPVEEPPPEEAPAAPPPPAAEPPKPEQRLRLGAGVSVGVLIRTPSVDPTISFEGTLPTGIVEPVLSMGLVYAPGSGLTAWELPLLAGLRLPIKLGAWRLTPYLLGGGRLHLFGPTSFDPTGGARFDAIGVGGISVLHAFGPVRLGVRLAVEFSAERQHLEGERVLWSREGFGFSTTVLLER